MYDILVIGGGPAGYTAAIEASKEGLTVALVEKSELGGTCLNRGCIPTKTLLHSSNAYQSMKQASTIGIHLDQISYNIDEIYSHKDELVSQLVKGIHALIQANKITYYHEEAYFINDSTIQTSKTNTILEAKNIIIATGSKPIRLPIKGIDNKKVYTSDDVLHAPIDAEEIVILGGGVIGVELATFFSQLDKKVTILELSNRILPTSDKEFSSNLAMTLKKNQVVIQTNSKLDAIEESATKLLLNYSSNDTSYTIECDALLLTVGRTGNLETLHLENTSIQKNGNYISVDEVYQTSVESIYAIGDVNGSVQLAHHAAYQAKACVHYIKHKTPIVNASIPYCIYTTPEIAYVGWTQEEAMEKGVEATTHKYLMNGNGKHLIEGFQRGFIKVVVASDNTILGAQIYADKATELITLFTQMIDLKAPYQNLTQIMYPHPTISEAIGESIENITGKAIHVLPKMR